MFEYYQTFMTLKSDPAIGDVDIRLLRVFRAVVECRGFANSEPTLNIGRSTISTHMSDLEHRLGIRLCERGPAGFSLTEQGRDVYEAAMRLLATIDTFSSDIGTIKGRISGRVNLGIVDNTITDPNAPLVAALDRFRTLTDQVHFCVHMLSADEIEQRVLDGRLDLGVLPRHGDVSEIRYETLYEEISVLCFGRGHPLFNQSPRNADRDALVRLPYIAHGYAERIQHHADTIGFEAAATAYSIEAVAMFILTGKFVGFLPDHYAAVWIERGEMGKIPMDTMSYKSQIAVIVRKNARQTLAVQSLIKELRNGIGLAARI